MSKSLIDFEPKFVTQIFTQDAPEPGEWTPEWVVDTWRRLYAVAPTAGVKAIVESAEAWLESQRGGGVDAVQEGGTEPLP